MRPRHDILDETQFKLRFDKEQEAVRPHEVPAAVLTQALSGVQRVVHLIAMHDEQREINARARVTQDIEQRFPVMCHLPTEGSYELPVSIGTQTPDLVDPDVIAKVAELSHRVFQALSVGDISSFRDLIPDAAFRRSISKAASDAAPNRRSGYRFGIHSSDGNRFFDAHSALPHIQEILQPAQETIEMTSVVTGSFIGVDFEARKLEIKQPTTNIKLECLYRDDVEQLLLNNPRELIQVVGNIELNSDGTLARITDVQDILEVDLSPISLYRVELDQGHLEARQPFTLTPALSETQQFYEIEDKELSISLKAFTRDELLDAVNEEIAVIWTEYARESDENLTNEARALKEKLNRVFEEQT